MKAIDFSLADAALVTRGMCAQADIYSSVATCMILKKVLTKFNIESNYLSVKTWIFNPFITKEFKVGKTLSQKRLNMLLDHKKGYSVSFGTSKETNNDEWSGHLVLMVDNLDSLNLIDPTVTQANSLEHKIDLFPIGTPVAQDFGTYDGSRAILRLNDCALIYTGFPTDRTYEKMLKFYEKSEELNVEVITNQIFEHLCLGG